MNIYPQHGADPRVVVELDLPEARQLSDTLWRDLGFDLSDIDNLNQAIADLEKGASALE